MVMHCYTSHCRDFSFILQNLGENLLKLASCVTRVALEQGGICIVKMPHKSVTWDTGVFPRFNLKDHLFSSVLWSDCRSVLPGMPLRTARNTCAMIKLDLCKHQYLLVGQPLENILQILLMYSLSWEEMYSLSWEEVLTLEWFALRIYDLSCWFIKCLSSCVKIFHSCEDITITSESQTGKHRPMLGAFCIWAENLSCHTCSVLRTRFLLSHLVISHDKKMQLILYRYDIICKYRVFIFSFL